MVSDLSRITSYQQDESVQKRRWIILIILNLFTFMSTLDASIVNVALPDISHRLHLPIANSEWVVTIYLMVICVFILMFGRLGDMFGKIMIFRIGTILFIAGSLLCGFSGNLPFLLAARVVQAVGASMTMANNFGIATDIFPGRERGRALGLIGTFVSLGGITGPGLGGFIVYSLGWNYIFWINVPIGIVVILLGWRMLPKDIYRSKGRLDKSGTLIFAAFIILLFTGLLLGQRFGYQDGRIISAILLAAVLLLVFIIVEWRKEEPMLQLKLFRNGLFSISIICAFLVFVSNFCFNIIAPFFTQDILGLTARDSGFVLMFFPMAMAVAAPLSGALSDKIGSEVLTFIGLMVLVASQIGLGFLNAGSPAIYVSLLVAVMGAGSGLFQSPNNSLVMSTVPRSQLGSAGSVNALIRNLGMIVGITFATSLLFFSMSVKAGYRVTGLVSGRPDIFLYAMHIVFLASAGICMVSAVLTGVRYIHSRRVHARIH
ncbi:MFS transporter [Sporolactobacillus putidus]|uniref:MFS transporter n=1 Tax=Sporolactobacillus putidus TaxID=492735 RepID=A0A917S9C0_9BACL|nr:MFS transporter [Sporolactobacillus putidus]GGL62450.1 MFS transporter [Sporolactobacillus putidus]